jgi:hypothetical protein
MRGYKLVKFCASLALVGLAAYPAGAGTIGDCRSPELFSTAAVNTVVLGYR